MVRAIFSLDNHTRSRQETFRLTRALPTCGPTRATIFTALEKRISNDLMRKEYQAPSLAKNGQWAKRDTPEYQKITRGDAC